MNEPRAWSYPKRRRRGLYSGLGSMMNIEGSDDSDNVRALNDS